MKRFKNILFLADRSDGLSTALDRAVSLSEINAARAREQQTDLIVMGTLCRAGIPGLIIGNTAEDVLREAQTAVLALKPRTFVSPIA